ncbi:MAG: exo-alpha-sialidase [Anaerolineae bacterium]|nr:exo-alpha-sialidase [Anaerolineae bacterium]
MTRSARVTHAGRAAGALVLVFVASMGFGARSAAQRSDGIWAPPVNVSQSGAASMPTVLTDQDGEMRTFWWDSLDGLTMADGTAGEWSEPVTTPIYEVEVLERPLADGSEALYTPIGVMPRIIGDPEGNAHAFWIGELVEGSRATALMYARMPAGRSAWSNARVVAESAASFVITVDADGWLYLAYSRNLHTTADPSAIVFRLSSDGGDRWSSAVTIHSSLYYRSATPEQLNLRIAADSEGLLVLTWNDPHLATALLAESLNSGDSWSEPVNVGRSAGSKALNARSFIAYGETASSAMVLWEGTDSLGACALYQSPLRDVTAASGSVGQRVLEGLNGCPSPESERLVPLDAEQAIMFNGNGTDTLVLSLWNGEAWSEPKRLAVQFDDTVTGRSIYLGELWATLVPTDNEGDTNASLAVVGVDTDGDVWITQSEVSALSIAFAPPPPWSQPVAVLQDSVGPDVPAMAVDREGVVHALWSEPASEGASQKVLRYARQSGTGWTRAATVMQSSMGSATEPSIAAFGDRLHAVWRDSVDGQIWYSRAYLQDAYSMGGWEEPRAGSTIPRQPMWESHGQTRCRSSMRRAPAGLPPTIRGLPSTR